MELRQKSINLIYLILLAMLFNYVPADYLDGIAESESGINLLKTDLERLGFENRSMILEELRGKQPIVFEETMTTLAEIDKSTRLMQQSIQDIKITLLHRSGTDMSTNERLLASSAITNEVMMEMGQAERLLDELRAHKERVKALIRAEYVDDVDSILPTPRTIGRMNGGFIRFESHYFESKPFSVALLNIALLSARVERLRSFAGDAVLGAFGGTQVSSQVTGIDLRTTDSPDNPLALDPGSQSSDRIMELNDFLKLRRLETIIPDQKIDNFKVSVHYVGGLATRRPFTNQGAEFSDELIELLFKTGKRDVVEFSEIKIIDSQGLHENAGKLRIRIK
ncbi:MAG: hypothetical protein H6606_08965 [Flavobacteriales bacterium]|nr:hypothetical protein [Flavobacteriales bacterium]